MTEPTESTPTRSQRVLSALSSGLTALLKNRVIQVVLVALFAAGASLVLTPGLRRKGPELSPSDVGNLAKNDIKASRTFQYVPPTDVLEQKRDETASQVLTVYNYYPERLRYAYESLSMAFSEAFDKEGLYREKTREVGSDRVEKKEGDEAEKESVTRKAGGKDTRRKPAAKKRRRRSGSSKKKETAGKKRGGKTKSRDEKEQEAGHEKVDGEIGKQKDTQAKRVLDQGKVKEAQDERWKVFNKTFNERLQDRTNIRRLLDRESFDVLYNYAMQQEEGGERLEVALRMVLLDDAILDNKYVRSALELKTDLGQIQKRILMRTIRFKPGSERKEVTREEVITNLTMIRELRDLRDRVALKVTGLPGFSKPLKKALSRMVRLALVENMVRDDEETAVRRQRARRKIAARPITYVKGQLLVRAGERVTQDQLRVISAMEGDPAMTGPWQVAAGMALFVLLFFSVLIWYGRRHLDDFRINHRDMFVSGVILLGLMALADVLGTLASVLEWPPSLVQMFMPVAAGSALLRLLIGGPAGILFSIGAAGLCAMAMDGGVTTVMYLFIGSLVGAGAVAKVQTRFVLWRAGALVALVNVVMLVLLRTFAGEIWNTGTFMAGASAVLGGLASGFLASALLPILEWMGGYTTDVSLLELANLNHPLLRDLLMHAPGTHHHSMVVGSLSEAGANAIGANGLMARVAAYYHDVGKMRTSHYFAENQRGDNPHGKLKPSMSVLIIKNHLKDSREILKKYRIPERIQEVALSHHGTTLIEYFYKRALEQAGDDEEIIENDYRYPGPKPQTRVAGILMLADAVEAAVKSLPNPDEEQLRSVVDRIINKKFIDGQLAECALTLRDLTKIAGAFLNVLVGMYHHRPIYPGQKNGYRSPEKSPSGMQFITTTRELKLQARAKERADRRARDTEKISTGDFGEGGKKEKSGKGEENEKSEKSGKGEENEKSEKSGKGEENEKSEKSGKGEENEKSGT